MALWVIACRGNASHVIDASPDAPDARLTLDGPAFADREGGNIIFEYLNLDSQLQAAFSLPSGVTAIERTIAYFSNQMTPEENPLPAPGQCNNLDATKGWPLFIGAPNIDVDIGTLTIDGNNTAGQAVSIAVPLQPAGKDALGRTHQIFYQGINQPAENFLKPDSNYRVSFGGTGAIAATQFPDALHMPNTFQVHDPPLENAPAMVTGQPYSVAWYPGSSNLPPDQNYREPFVLGFTWLLDMTGKPTHICSIEHSAGMFVIPAATISEYKQLAQTRGTDPSHVLLYRSAVVHIFVPLANGDPTNQRRIDMLAMFGWVQVVGVTL